MRRAWWLLPAVVAVPFSMADAQGCLPTPEAAAQSVIGSMASATATSPVGFRVRDVQTDPLMHRVWVRVSRCDAPGMPLILVPMHAPWLGVLPLMSETTASGALDGPVPVRASTAPASGPRTIAIHAGDPVLVTFASSAVHMELEGTAEQAAALGETVGIALRRRGDEPLHRMRGILRADHHVEVRQ